MRTAVARRAGMILAGLLIVSLMGPLQARDDKDDARVYEAGAKVEGKTYAEWSAAWWQWGLGIKKDRNPILDRTGELAAEGQSGPVWFLAGNVGGTTTRKCVVPAGKPIFFPILNYLGNSEPDQADEKQLLLTPKAEMDRAADMKVTLDDKPITKLERFRVASKLFAFTGPTKAADGLFDGIAGKQKGVSDGYWIMLKPLSPGKHTLHFQGRVKEGKDTSFELDVTYELTAEAKKQRPRHRTRRPLQLLPVSGGRYAASHQAGARHT